MYSPAGREGKDNRMWGGAGKQNALHYSSYSCMHFTIAKILLCSVLAFQKLHQTRREYEGGLPSKADFADREGDRGQKWFFKRRLMPFIKWNNPFPFYIWIQLCQQAQTEISSNDKM